MVNGPEYTWIHRILLVSCIIQLLGHHLDTPPTGDNFTRDWKIAYHVAIQWLNSGLNLNNRKLVRKGLGAKLRYMGYFASLLHPKEEKLGYYFKLGTCLGA